MIKQLEKKPTMYIVGVKTPITNAMQRLVNEHGLTVQYITPKEAEEMGIPKRNEIQKLRDPMRVMLAYNPILGNRRTRRKAGK